MFALLLCFHSWCTKYVYVIIMNYSGLTLYWLHCTLLLFFPLNTHEQIFKTSFYIHKWDVHRTKMQAIRKIHPSWWNPTHHTEITQCLFCFSFHWPGYWSGLASCRQELGAMVFWVVERLWALGQGRCCANLNKVSSSLACDSQIPPAKLATERVSEKSL